MSGERQADPWNFSLWTEEKLAELSLFDLILVSFDGEASMHPGGIGATKKLLADLEIGPDDNVLEIGCGSGKDLCRMVKKYGCRATGVDYSELMVRFAKHEVERLGLESKIRIIKGDITNLDLDDEAFDVAFAQSVLTAVGDKAKAAREISRILRPDGRFGVIEMTWLDEADEELIRKIEPRTESFDRPLKYQHWIELFTREGLEVKSTFHSNDFGFPSNLIDFIRSQGLIRGIKMIIRTIRRDGQTHLRKRSEHTLWMKESGKIGHGVFLFRKHRKHS